MITISQFTMTVGLLPEFIAIIYSFKGLKKSHYVYFRYMFMTWAFLFLGNLLLAISYFNLDFIMYRIGIIINIPLCFTIIILMDSISSSHLDWKKMVAATFFSTTVLITAWEPNAVRLNVTGLGEITPAINGVFLIWSSLLFIFIGLNWLFYSIKIRINAPSKVRKMANINLIGAIIAGPGSMLAFSLGIVWYFPGTDYILIAIGAIFFSKSFQKHPNLGYVLPFTIYRIMIIHSESNALIYKYSWKKIGSVDPNLFANALGGISALLQESLEQWRLRELKFEEGKLLLHKSKTLPIVYALIVSETNNVLLNGLNLFDGLFSKKFAPLFKKDEDTIDLTPFKESLTLVEKAFPIIL
ncbi:MAG: hypothetical protein ACP6IY_20725 [Promethearchaeia archaeon]